MAWLSVVANGSHFHSGTHVGIENRREYDTANLNAGITENRS